MTLRRILIGGGVLLALVVMLFVAALASIFFGRGSPVETARQEERCEFAEGQKPQPQGFFGELGPGSVISFTRGLEYDLCLNEVGDVYFRTAAHDAYEGGACWTPSEGPGACEPGAFIGPAGELCVKDLSIDFCADPESGKVQPGAILPLDICGNGTFRAPCDPEEAEAWPPTSPA